MMEAGAVHVGGRGRRPRSPVRPRTACLVVLAALFGLVLPGPGGAGPARAGPGCQVAPRGATRTVEGLPKESGEASGFAASQRYPGALWMIRDSGHPPDLYALRFNPDGVATNRVMPVAGANNKDWEDVTRFDRPDGSSALWIVESGQTGTERYVYEVPEPDPDHDVVAHAVARYAYAYPDAKSNTEAAFTYDNKLVLVAKTFPAKVYRFDKPLSTSGVNVPTLLGELSDSRGVSVAKPSPDRHWLVTATHDTLFIYRNRGSGSLEDFLDREPFHALVIAPGDNVESGDFDPAFGDCTMILGSENRNSYRVRAEGS
ncbi:MAG: hypothetical protein QOJ23_4933 [Actinomycetota bacterium]|nr:hypothetical protein [Actinomycetota bacterium]